MYADLVLARWTLEYVARARARARARAKAYSTFSTQYSVTTTQG